MKQLNNKPFFLFLLVAFFLLHGTVENYGFIYFSEIVKTGLAIFSSVALFYLITYLLVKNSVQSALIVFFISAWILFFGAIFDWVKSVLFLHWIHSYTVFIPLMLFIFIAFILFIRRKKILQNKLCFYLNVLLLIYCLFDLCALTIKAMQPNKQAAAKNINFDTTLVKSKPNVYFMLFDEYPGYKSLRDSFAFANDSLYHFLEKKEFKILPTFSNYNMTFYSMASMLNMDYVNHPYEHLVNTKDEQVRANTMKDDQMRIKEIKNARAIQYFKSMGYHFTNYSIFDILDQPSLKGNSFVISQATLITNKIFFNKLIKDVGWHFIAGKYSIPFIKNIYMAEDRNNNFIIKTLTDSTSNLPGNPAFIYAHFNMPHPPIFYDSSGNYLPVAKIFDDATYANKQTFLSYLKYTNGKIEKMVDAIVKKDSQAIVIVMSDHGYRNYHNSKTFEPLHFDNVCAVRFPDKNYLPLKEQWSNVNFFRYLLNCEFDQRIPYLSDSSIFLKDKKASD